MKTIKFALFSDFHYHEGKYISSVADLEAILKRANDAKVDFVLQAGDFCNNLPASPEIFKVFLENEYGLDVYGIMGNHDLENGGKMSTVTPTLTNRHDNVIWGTSDGKIGDGSIAYYYYEVNGFRIICCDSDYYYQTEEKIWKHYPSWYPGPGKDDEGKYSNINSLGPVQLSWLEGVIMDAAKKKLHCIVVTHASLAGNRGPSQSADNEAARAIFKRANEIQKGTVLVSVNGHHHTNIHEVIDGIFYLDMNTTRNGAWYYDGEEHYTDETFEFVEHDDDGNVKSVSVRKVAELANSRKTWYFTDPTSAIVTVSSDGKVVVEGCETSWLYGIEPGRGAVGEEPYVSSGTYYVAG